MVFKGAFNLINGRKGKTMIFDSLIKSFESIIDVAKKIQSLGS